MATEVDGGSEWPTLGLLLVLAAAAHMDDEWAARTNVDDDDGGTRYIGSFIGIYDILIPGLGKKWERNRCQEFPGLAALDCTLLWSW